jgi:uncharacterized membrane protein YdbT with pleckstrin-like domain
MSYVESHLLNGEKIEHISHLHWKLYIVPSIISFIVLIASIGIFTSHHHGAGILAILISIGLVAWPYFVIKNSEFAVTNKRVIIKVGVIKTTSLELFLNKIEAITVDQSIIGRMLNYGNIIVTGSGGTKEPFSGIKAPLDFRRAVHQATDSISA